MKTLSESLTRYLEKAKIEELEREWKAKGYQVFREELVGDLKADLVAKRNGETVVLEVKTASSLARYRDIIGQLARAAAEQPDTTFHLVITNPPRSKSIEVEGLADRLINHLAHELPNELDVLSTHTLVESIEKHRGIWSASPTKPSPCTGRWHHPRPIAVRF